MASIRRTELKDYTSLCSVFLSW